MDTLSKEDRELPGWEVIEAAVAAADERLEDRLASAYAIGSLAHGGFAPAVSDVDLALLTDGPVEDMAAILEEVQDDPEAAAVARRTQAYAPDRDRSDDPATGADTAAGDRFGPDGSRT